jgi:putative transposase
MSAERFSVGKQFEWHGILCEIKRLLPEGVVNFEEVVNGAVRIEKVQILVEALFAGQLRFVAPPASGKGHPPNPVLPAATLDLSDYPEWQVNAARARLKAIEPLLSLAPLERTPDVIRIRLEETKAEIGGSPDQQRLLRGLSRRSIFRWLHDYLRSGCDLRSLIPQYSRCGAKGLPRLEEGLTTLVECVIKDHYYRREKVTVDDLYALVAARIQEENRVRPAGEQLRLPSRATVSRRINNLDMCERLKAKQGVRSAKQQLTQVGQTPYPQLPLERVEIDHTRIDLIVVDAKDNLPLGRPTLTYSIDAATRYPLGYYLGFEPPSYYTVMECLYHMICPKPDTKGIFGTEHNWVAYGIPSNLVIDNGKELIGQHLSDACALLGITLIYSPVRTPEFKAGIERQFGTLNSGLFHTLPGTTFSNFLERRDYDSVQQAVFSLDEIERALNLFVVDIYAERFHSGLSGIPARRWENAVQSVFFPRVPPNRDELRILLGRVGWRVIHRYGIEFERLRYNCQDLAILRARLKGETVKIKYHPGDLSRLYVFDPFEKRYIEALALDQEYTQGLSLWKHKVILNFARQEQHEVDAAALGHARQKIQDMVDAARKRKRVRMRTKIARWDNAGKLPNAAKQTPSPGRPVLNPASPVPDKMSAARSEEPSDVLSSQNLDNDGWELVPDGLLKISQAEEVRKAS